MLDKITDNTQILMIGFLFLVFFAGIGIGYYGLPNVDTTEQQPDPNDSELSFNSSELIKAHQSNLNAQRPYSLTFSATSSPPENATLLIIQNEQVRVQQNGTHITSQAVRGQQTEMWVGQNQTLLYYPNNDSVEESTLTRPENRQTKYLFVQQVLNAGTYEYTKVSITDESKFELTTLTDTQSLLYAYPGLSGRDSGEVTNITINGTVKNGVITNLNGTFDYKPTPETNNSTQEFQQQQYSFNLTVDTTVQSQAPPTWAQEYIQNQNTSTEQEESTNTTTETTTNETDSNTTETNNTSAILHPFA